MSERIRAIYRERLNLQDEVYFLGVEGVIEVGDGPLVVKKGTIDQTISRSGEPLKNPLIKLDSSNDLLLSTGKAMPIFVDRSPLEIFRKDEANIHLRKELDDNTADIDEIVKRDPRDKKVVSILSEAVIDRGIEDLLDDSEL